MAIAKLFALNANPIIPTCRNFDVYLHAKDELHS